MTDRLRKAFCDYLVTKLSPTWADNESTIIIDELWADAWKAATSAADAEIRRWKARCIAAENGHPQVKEATAEAEAKYLPVIEKLVDGLRKVLRDPGMHGLSINTRERIHSGISLAEPLLGKKEEV